MTAGKMALERVLATEAVLSRDFDLRLSEVASEGLVIRLRSNGQKFQRWTKSEYRQDMNLVRGYYRGAVKLDWRRAIEGAESAIHVHQASKDWSHMSARLAGLLGNRFQDRNIDWPDVGQCVSNWESLMTSKRIETPTLTALLRDDSAINAFRSLIGNTPNNLGRAADLWQ